MRAGVRRGPRESNGDTLRVLIHTQYYPPEMGAPQARLHSLARQLVRRGMQVTVLTAMPNYPTGRIYSGYGGLAGSERMNGVRVLRTWIYASQTSKVLPRLLSYFSFVLSSVIMGWSRIGDADFLLTESPPLFLGLAGLVLARRANARWIFNVSDLWPRSAVELGVIRSGSMSHRVGEWLERLFYENAWAVTGQSRTILDDVRIRFPRVRTYLLANGVDTKVFRPTERSSKGSRMRVAYAGLHGLAQGLQQVLLAARRMGLEEGIEFSLIGDGPEKQQLIRMSQDLGLMNVRFLPPVMQSEIPRILGWADAILVPLKAKLTGAIPSKLYEAMALGRAVILIAEGEATHIVNAARCGLVVQPGDIDGLVSAIRFLKRHHVERVEMGARGRVAAVRDHDRTRVAEEFMTFLNEEHSKEPRHT